MLESIEHTHQNRKDGKVLAAILHMISPWGFWALITSGVVWLICKSRSRVLAAQAAQAFLFQLTLLLAFGATSLFYLVEYLYASSNDLITKTGGAEHQITASLTTFDMIAIALIFFVKFILPLYGIWGGVQILRGRNFRYPILGRLAIRWTARQPFKAKTEAETPRPAAQNDDRIIAGLGHAAIFFGFSIFLGPVLWASNKSRSQFLSHHLFQASFFQISITVLFAILYVGFWQAGY